MEQESNFKNIFGSDPVSNPYKTTSYADPMQVTKARYLDYKRLRPTKGMQGVGLTQLTWWEFQDQADRLGGCWRPSNQLRVGFGLLRSKMQSGGSVWKALKAYNGTGPSAERYADQVTNRYESWKRRLA